ncbi:hypothetical protein RNZ50_00415 [Paracoccaceae bacterium Fryx2]|nr:hypothetical protein [Paracoccaceae bacterium Fryx2]
MNLFSETHAQLLPVLRQDGSALESDPVRSVLHGLRQRLMLAYCVHAFVAYERYLDIFSLRLGNRSLQEAFTLAGWDFFEEEFRKDPSRPDIAIGLAVARIRAGDIGRGRHLLRRVAASGFRERDLARQLLGKLA